MHVLDMFKLNGKIALVTGGGGNLGFQITEALAEMGAKVIIASRDLKKCQKRAQEFHGQGLDVIGMELDIGKEESVVDLKEKIIKQYNHVDILVQNVYGRYGQSPLVEEIDEKTWTMSMKINATGFFLCAKHFIPQMVEQRSGNIIHIASIYGVVGPHPSVYEGTTMEKVRNGDYSFVKGGLITFTKHLSAYYAKYNIRANSISPGGFYDTTMDPKFVRRYKKLTPLGRMGNETDLKGAVVYLASDASAWVTGINLLVDGGWTLW